MTRADRPTIEQVERELARRENISRYTKAFRITVVTLIVVVAVAVLVATLWLPVLKVSGTSMTPSLYQDEIIVVMKDSDFKCGEIAAFYYNNKILIKRVIAGEGDWVDIDSEGNVYVNDVMIDEPYAVDKSEGSCDVDFPCQVPEDCWFVLGDHRSTSIDSRSTEVGFIKDEDMLGRIFCRVYPFKRFKFFR
jgi:signal peptidase I